MNNISDFESNEEHEVAELLCLKCLNRWIGVYPSKVLLKNIECKCGETGYVIKTGQTLSKEKLCDTCRFNKNGCTLCLSGTDIYCEYYKKENKQ